MTNVIVEVDYYPHITLDGSHVEDGGKLFDCSRCCGGGNNVLCCNDLNGGRSNGCKKCSCQGKTNGTCCRYKGDGGCPGKCTSSCTNGNCTVNADIYDYNTVATGSYTCTDAFSLINNPTKKGRVTDASAAAIRAQCDPTTRLKCCQSDTSLNSNVCGQFWGQDKDHRCDSIMQSFCDINPTDPLCACIESVIPSPECMDKTCHNTTAMKLTNMLNNPCSGNYMLCQQFLTLSPEAKNNVIDKITMEQTCNQNIDTGDAAKGTSSNNNNNIMKWVIIAVVGIIGVTTIAGILSIKPSKARIPKTPIRSGTKTVPATPLPQRTINSVSQPKTVNVPNVAPVQLPMRPIIKKPYQPKNVKQSNTPVVVKRYIVKN